MKKRKLKLDNLKVDSFKTSNNEEDFNTIKGGSIRCSIEPYARCVDTRNGCLTFDCPPPTRVNCGTHNCPTRNGCTSPIDCLQSQLIRCFTLEPYGRCIEP